MPWFLRASAAMMIAGLSYAAATGQSRSPAVGTPTQALLPMIRDNPLKMADFRQQIPHTGDMGTIDTSGLEATFEQSGKSKKNCPTCLPGDEIFSWPPPPTGLGRSDQTPHCNPPDDSRVPLIEQVNNESIGLYNSIGLELIVEIDILNQKQVKIKLKPGQITSVILKETANITVSIPAGAGIYTQPRTAKLNPGIFYYISSDNNNLKISSI